MTTENYNDRQKYKIILSAVHMVYRLVNSTYNVKELATRLTRLLCQFVKARSASVYILDPDKKKVILIASYNNKVHVLKNKKKDLLHIPEREKAVIKGKSIFEKHLIGLPLVSYDNVGALFVRREGRDSSFTDLDREMVSVFAEQSVTAIKNLQLNEEQQRIILGSMKFIGQLVKKKGPVSSTHTPVYFKILKCLAEKIHMSQQGIDCLRYASVLHDAGTIDVPYEILSKRSQLTAEEFKIIHNHPAKSAELIRPLEFLKPVLPIILYHHEKYNGMGYPSGLKKEQIPLGARVIAVVDAFEAMIRERPYKKVLTIDEALLELKRNSGTQFDPDIVDAFCALAKQKKFRAYLNLIRH
ncbi:MAG: HD domain-containing phosphohydrolase [Candidatus Omnitrophota bacterium]